MSKMHKVDKHLNSDLALALKLVYHIIDRAGSRILEKGAQYLFEK